LIGGCLDSLKNQTVDFSNFEVIVIDNNSKDNTVQIVQDYSSLPNLRLVRESKQGLSHARNRGIKEAKGNYVGFIDDDARVSPHYIENLLKLLNRFSDSIDCYGGPILPFYTTEKPVWFLDKYEVRRDKKAEHTLTKGQTFSGSNMIWKRDLLVTLCGFDPSFGVRENLLILGEETALFDHLWEMGKPNLLFSPDLIVFHWVSPCKMRVFYRLNRSYAVGQAIGRIETKSINTVEKIKYFFFHSFRIWINCIKAVLNIGRHRWVQNWIVEELSPIVTTFGKLLSIF